MDARMSDDALMTAVTDGILAIVGDNLRHLRDEREWSQEDVARKLGVTNRMISNYEHGYSQMSLVTFLTLANVYGIAPARLLARMQPAKVAPSVAKRATSPTGVPRLRPRREIINDVMRDSDDRPTSPTDHSACNPRKPESLCGDCRGLMDDARSERI
jgi:transcriptional regulator with XRE-family HTH domain